METEIGTERGSATDLETGNEIGTEKGIENHTGNEKGTGETGAGTEIEAAIGTTSTGVLVGVEAGARVGTAGTAGLVREMIESLNETSDEKEKSVTEGSESSLRMKEKPSKQKEMVGLCLPSIFRLGLQKGSYTSSLRKLER